MLFILFIVNYVTHSWIAIYKEVLYLYIYSCPLHKILHCSPLNGINDEQNEHL